MAIDPQDIRIGEMTAEEFIGLVNATVQWRINDGVEEHPVRHYVRRRHVQNGFFDIPTG